MTLTNERLHIQARFVREALSAGITAIRLQIVSVFCRSISLHRLSLLPTNLAFYRYDDYFSVMLTAGG